MGKDITGQMSIFDYLGEFANMPEEHMVQELGQKLGIKFSLEKLEKGIYKYKLQYEYKRKGLRLTCGYATDMENKIFISAGWSKRTAGGSAPCDTMERAVQYFGYIIKEYG